MKKLFLSILMSLLVGMLSAQTVSEEAGKLKNAGNAAWKTKSYKEAFTNWENYLKAVEFKDDVTIYNVAVCANKLKDYVAAEKYFGMSIKNNYKLKDSYAGKADAEKNLKKIAEMLKTLEDGIKATPGQNSGLKRTYAVYFLKEGQKFQKANNIAKAAENYQKIAGMTDKGFKAQGLVSLGTLFFNNGAAILQEATPFANKENDKYEAGKAKAMAEFKKAQGYLIEAMGADPKNVEAPGVLKEVKDAMLRLTTPQK